MSEEDRRSEFSFSADGLTAWLPSYNEGKVFEYMLSFPRDLATAKYVGEKEEASHE